MERFPINEGTVIEINNVKIAVNDFVGEGSTCLVYSGRISEDSKIMPGTAVMIKEFYPKSKNCVFDIERDDSGKLHFSEITKEFTEFKSRWEQFEAGYTAQKELANTEAMEITILPQLYGKYGDSTYIISDIHMGESLERVSFDTLGEKLSCAVRVAEMLGILHKAGYMMMDFKPENILWIPSPQMVKLIDADSILEKDSLYMNNRYCAPEIRTLKEMVERGKALLEEKRSAYLKPHVNVYSLGVYLFELLFERIPTDEDLKFPDSLQKELFYKYKDDFKSEAIAEQLLGVMKRAMKRSAGLRFPNAYEMMETLNAAFEKITSQKYIPKREIASANGTYLSYNMIEKYPLYDYARKVENQTVMDVAIVGTHSFRESLLKTIIPCGQMLESRLNIRLIAKDAEAFWKKFSSKECNPELRRTIQWFLDGNPVNSEGKIRQAEIVEEPLAFVYLYTDDSAETVNKIIKEEHVSYLIFSEKDESENAAKMQAIVKKLPKRKCFVAYLTQKSKKLLEGHEKTVVYPIGMEKSSERYNEEAVKSRIYRMGLSVHEYYYRGNNPRATMAEVRDSFAKDTYNIESSERCALHVNYKLKSIGIDPKSKKAPYVFYEKVLGSKEGDAKELFDKLVALEHRSWTAFMVLNGVRSVDDMDATFKSYAYDGNSDWKWKNQKGQVISHPCLRSSRPGRKLDAAIWENYKTLSEKKRKEIDALDKRSLEIYDAVKKIALERKESVFGRVNELESGFLENASEVAVSAFRTFVYATEKVFASETNSDKLWKQALSEWKVLGENEGLLNGNQRKIIGDIEQMMQPALWTVNRHDFKHSDEDIVRAIPKLLMSSENEKNANPQVTIIKPIAKNAWQNLFSTIVVTPDLLVLVPMKGEEEAEFEQYSLWLKMCHVDTKVLVKSPKQLREYGGKEGHIFIDETGVEPEHSRMLMNNPFMKSAHTFRVEDRKLKSTDGNTLISLFDRAINLTVQETLMLHGATMISENMPDYVAQLTMAEYKTIWNLYRDLGDGKKWKIFINELERLEEGKKQKVKLNDQAELARYETTYVEHEALKRTGMEKALRQLERQKLIEKCVIPENGKYGKILFATAYKKLAEELLILVSKIAKDNTYHAFEMKIKEETVYIYDYSLYVSGVVQHKASTDITSETIYRDEVVKEVLCLLDEKNKDKILQNIQIDDGRKHISFRYSSRAVREVLKSEGSILEALTYWECKRYGVFDDVRANVTFLWADNRTQNELDIVGTKNSKTYFISAKMQAPDNMHMYEVKILSDRFGIEGEAILVSSHDTSGKQSALRERSQGIENVTYLGADAVDYMDTKSRCRKLRIGESIQKIVRGE